MGWLTRGRADAGFLGMAVGAAHAKQVAQDPLQQRVELLRVLPLDLTKLTACGLRRGGHAGVSRAWRDEAAKEGAPGARLRSAPSRGA